MTVCKLPSIEQLKFWKSLEGVKSLIDCTSCCSCCYRDLTYLFPFEVDFYEDSGIATVEVEGIRYLKKNSEACPFLQEGRCSIYEHRPITCRLFPLEIISSKEGLSWALFKPDYCSKHYTLDADERNVFIYLMLQKLTPIFSPYIAFLYKHNTVDVNIDVHRSELKHYHSIKEIACTDSLVSAY